MFATYSDDSDDQIVWMVVKNGPRSRTLGVSLIHVRAVVEGMKFPTPPYQGQALAKILGHSSNQKIRLFPAT